MALYLASLGRPPVVSTDYVAAVMAQVPKSDFPWGMDGNDTFGDCVFADSSHQAMLYTANTGKIWIPTVQETLGLYSAVTGFNPDDPNTDRGANELSTIDYLTKFGYGGYKLLGHANINPTNAEHLRWTVELFGCSRLGINLPEHAETQFDAGVPWAPVKGEKYVGGHDVLLVKYLPNMYFVVTWGRLQPVSPPFFTAKYADGTPYVEEAHAELHPAWIEQNGRKQGFSPSGHDLKTLIADLRVVSN